MLNRKHRKEGKGKERNASVWVLWSWRHLWRSHEAVGSAAWHKGCEQGCKLPPPSTASLPRGPCILKKSVPLCKMDCVQSRGLCPGTLCSYLSLRTFTPASRGMVWPTEVICDLKNLPCFPGALGTEA